MESKREAENRKEEIISIFLNYITCFTLVGITLLATFLMPQIYNYNTDRNTVGKVNFVKREEVELMTDFDLAVKDRTAIVTNLVSEGGISLLLNLEGSQLYNEELVSSVMKEVRWAVSCGILPAEFENLNLNEQTGTLAADYFILSNSVTEYGEMALWRIDYNDFSKWDVTFLVDAENYKIYYCEIGGAEMANAWERNYSSKGEGGYMALCMQYYEAEYAERLWEESIFEIEDAGVFGCAKETTNIKQPDGYQVIFGYDVFWEYFYGKTVFDFYNLKYENDTTMLQKQND